MCLLWHFSASRRDAANWRDAIAKQRCCMPQLPARCSTARCRTGHCALQRPVCRWLAAQHHRHAAVRASWLSGGGGGSTLVPGRQAGCAARSVGRGKKVKLSIACCPPQPTPTHSALPCRGLRSLTLDDIQCRLYREPLAELGRLTQLTHLTVSATQRHGVFIFGMDSIPDTWAHLQHLRALELRGNALLEALPDWLPGALPGLELLDVSACSRLDLQGVVGFKQLKTLAIQVGWVGGRDGCAVACCSGFHARILKPEKRELLYGDLDDGLTDRPSPTPIHPDPGHGPGVQLHPPPLPLIQRHPQSHPTTNQPISPHHLPIHPHRPWTWCAAPPPRGCWPRRRSTEWWPASSTCQIFRRWPTSPL